MTTPAPASWTKEPWTLQPPDGTGRATVIASVGKIGLRGSGVAIAQVLGCGSESHVREESLAVGRRIVSCVNALSGVSDPAALISAVDELVKAANIGLEALLVYDYNEHSIKPETNNTEPVKSIRAALSKLAAARKGKQ